MDSQSVSIYNIDERKVTFESRLKVKAIGTIVDLMKKHGITVSDIEGYSKPSKMDRLMESRHIQSHKVKAHAALVKAREARKNRLSV